MPILIIVLALFCGLGFFLRGNEHEPHRASQAAIVEPARMEAAPAAWTDACRDRLQAATSEFAPQGCAGPGAVTVSLLPSGVPYVEYALHGADGSDYGVAITEEPQNPGETSGWHGAPGCRGYDHAFEVVRHDNGRLARVSANGDRGLEFARAVEAAADFCVEQAQ
jgi:hypothetical protein